MKVLFLLFFFSRVIVTIEIKNTVIINIITIMFNDL